MRAFCKSRFTIEKWETFLLKPPNPLSLSPVPGAREVDASQSLLLRRHDKDVSCPHLGEGCP